MQKRILLLLFIFLIFNISGVCEDNQININKASLEELDQLSGIGPSKAQAIIDFRPFNSVDDLIDVTGIGEVTLEKIKSQGIVCVNEENEEEIITESAKNNFIEIKETKIQSIQKELIVLENLDTKDIKSEKNKEKLDKNNYAIYGLTGFGVLLLFLFIIKNRGLIKKNEFK